MTLCKSRLSGTFIPLARNASFFPAFKIFFYFLVHHCIIYYHNHMPLGDDGADPHRKYVLFTGLQLRRVQNESPVLLSLISGLPREAYERTGQIFFERFNVAAFSILDRPMAQLYAASAISGVVVDISDTVTDITPIYDGIPLTGARTTVGVGMHHCERFLAHLLRNNTSVSGLLTELAIPPAEQPAALRAVARQVWQAGLVRVPVDGIAVREAEDEGVTDIAAVLVAGKEKAVIESGMKRRATAKATAAEQARAKEIEALDLITVEFRGKEVTLGKERHRFCEPLFDVNLLSHGGGITLDEHASPKGDGTPMALQDGVNHAVRLADVDQRQYIWHGLMVTGDVVTHVKGEFLPANPVRRYLTANWRHRAGAANACRPVHS